MYFKNIRCNICQRVSHGEISKEYGDQFPGAFVQDPKGFGYLCYDCSSSIQDVLTEWEIEDEEKEAKAERDELNAEGYIIDV